MSQAQFRAKSGAPAIRNDGVVTDEIESAGFVGKAQIKAEGARMENWLWLPVGAGAAGTGCGSGDDFAAQQGIVQPWPQQELAFMAQGAAVCAANSGVPASRKLQMMASANFMV